MSLKRYGRRKNGDISIMNDKLIKISEELSKQDLFTKYSQFITEDLFRFEFIKKLFRQNNLVIEKPYVKKGNNNGLLDSSWLTELNSKSRTRLDLCCFNKDNKKYAFEFKYNKQCSISSGCPATFYGSCLNDIRRLSILSNYDYVCYFVYLHKKGYWGDKSRALIRHKLLPTKVAAKIFRIKDLVDISQKEYSKQSHSSFQGTTERGKEKSACKNDGKKCEIICNQDFFESYHLTVIKI